LIVLKWVKERLGKNTSVVNLGKVPIWVASTSTTKRLKVSRPTAPSNFDPIFFISSELVWKPALRVHLLEESISDTVAQNP
jgi:hypothetical protein